MTPLPDGGSRADETGSGQRISVEDYDYELPADRIAQEPAPSRDRSRLMVLDRRRPGLKHLTFRNLPEILHSGDLLVLNDTRVINARLEGRKPSGGKLDFLFIETLGDTRSWSTLCQGARKLPLGTQIRFGGEMIGTVMGWKGSTVELQFPCGTDVQAVLNSRGAVPLPPYIRREVSDRRTQDDMRRYQTVFARHPGAVAAPTAGLHFTTELLSELRSQGVQICALTLHVGPGTFAPVRERDARRHKLLPERFVLPAETAEAIARTKESGKRVVAVGTTVTRVLEYVANRGTWIAQEGHCDLLLLPGCRFLGVDSLITNFHLPRTTLLLLVAAFAGRERVLAAYREAVASHYRFYSYGDAMIIL